MSCYAHVSMYLLLFQARIMVKAYVREVGFEPKDDVFGAHYSPANINRYGRETEEWASVGMGQDVAECLAL